MRNSYFVWIIMKKLSPDKILSKRTFVLAQQALLRCCLNVSLLLFISGKLNSYTYMQNDLLISYFMWIMIKLSPDKILSKSTFVLAALLSQRLAVRNKKSYTFYANWFDYLLSNVNNNNTGIPWFTLLIWEYKKKLEAKTA